MLNLKNESYTFFKYLFFLCYLFSDNCVTEWTRLFTISKVISMSQPLGETDIFMK